MIGYSQNQLNEHLAYIKSITPLLTSLELDLPVSTHRDCFQVTLRRGSSRKIHFDIAHGAQTLQAGDLQHISTFLSIPISVANQLGTQLIAIGKINSNGAWLLKTDAHQTLPFTGEFTGHKFIQHIVSNIANCAPLISAISTEIQVEHRPDSSKRTKVIARLSGEQSMELAAIDVGAIKNHVSDLVLNVGDHAKRNRERASIWAKQLGGVSIDDMPELLTCIRSLSETLQIARISIKNTPKTE